MALKLYSDTDIQNIADAIRSKNGESTTYKVSEMASAISAISGGGSTPVLPSAYQQVEYIEATGTQYIDTGVMPTENNVAEVDFELTGYVNTGYIALVSASSHMYLVHFADSSGSNIHFVPSWYNYESGTIYYPVTLNIKYHSICISKRNSTNTGGCAVTTEGAFTGNTSGTATYTPTNTYYVFARNNGNGVSYQAKAKLYNLTLYTDGVKQREFYPCYRKSDDVIGLYDVVNDVFYTNSGTGTFGKGGDV